MEKIVENFFIWRTDLKRLNDLITPSSSSQVQTEIIQRTVGSHLNRTFPVFSEFNLRFCKHVIRLLENCNCEVQDEFYELIQQTLLISKKSESFKSYFLGSQTISLLEKPELIRYYLKNKTWGVYFSELPPALPSGVQGMIINYFGEKLKMEHLKASFLISF